MLNNYTRHSRIGGGQHGEVYLCYKINPRYPPGHPDRRMPVVRSLSIFRILALIGSARDAGYEIRETRQPQGGAVQALEAAAPPVVRTHSTR